MLKLRIGGLRLEVSPLFFSVLTLALAFSENSTVMMAVLAAAAHEAGHFTGMLITGEIPKKLMLTPFGIRIERSAQMNIASDAAVYLAGPAVNLTAAAFFTVGRGESAAAVNLLMGLFNLLPVGRLDGGCILRLVLERLFGPRAEKIALAADALLLAPMLLLGAYLAFAQKNFTLLFTAAYLAIAVVSDR